MLLPVRCFSCNQLLADKDMLYKDYLQKGMTEKEAMDLLGLRRFCCRRLMLTCVDMTRQLNMYNKNKPNELYDTARVITLYTTD